MAGLRMFWGSAPFSRDARELRLEGRLLEEAGGLVVEMDDGGRWRLEADREARALLGRRVIVVGWRAGYDLISVTEIGAAKR